MTLLLQGAGVQSLGGAAAPAHYLNVAFGGDGATTPDQAAFDSGSATVEIRVWAALNNWASGGGFQSLLAQGNGATGRWALWVVGDGTLRMQYWKAGGTGVGHISTVPTGLANNATKWIKALLNPAVASTDFSMSDDGSAFSPLGAQVTTSAAAIQTVVAPSVETGSDVFNENVIGKIFRSMLFIGGVKKLDMDFSNATPGAGPWVATTGETWTAKGSATVI